MSNHNKKIKAINTSKEQLKVLWPDEKEKVIFPFFQKEREKANKGKEAEIQPMDENTHVEVLKKEDKQKEAKIQPVLENTYVENQKKEDKQKEAKIQPMDENTCRKPKGGGQTKRGILQPVD